MQTLIPSVTLRNAWGWRVIFLKFERGINRRHKIADSGIIFNPFALFQIEN